MANTPLFPVFYLGPISYYKALVQYPTIQFEVCEHFVKQSYRSRCVIAGNHGKLPLVIPTRKDAVKTKMRDMHVTYEEKWQRDHWRSFQMNYRSSPYFEFYEDDFKPFYHEEINSLVDFNLALHDKIMELLQLEVPYERSNSYATDLAHGMDYRLAFPTKASKEQNSVDVRYTQVFDDRNGFLNDLSIVDLLFNVGPQSTSFLR